MSCGLCGMPGFAGMCAKCRENTDNIPDEDETPKEFIFGQEFRCGVEYNTGTCGDCYFPIGGGEFFFMVFYCSVDDPDLWFKKEKKCQGCFQDFCLTHKDVEIVD